MGNQPLYDSVRYFLRVGTRESKKVRKKEKIRNRYNQAPQLTQDTLWESDKIIRKCHIQKCLEVSPFPASDHKAARHRQGNMDQYVKDKHK